MFLNLVPDRADPALEQGLIHSPLSHTLSPPCSHGAILVHFDLSMHVQKLITTCCYKHICLSRPVVAAVFMYEDRIS